MRFCSIRFYLGDAAISLAAGAVTLSMGQGLLNTPGTPFLFAGPSRMCSQEAQANPGTEPVSNSARTNLSHCGGSGH